MIDKFDCVNSMTLAEIVENIFGIHLNLYQRKYLEMLESNPISPMYRFVTGGWCW